MVSEANSIAFISILQIIIPSAITIIGLLITFFAAKRNISAEIEKQKLSKWLEKISDLPMEILGLINDMLDKKSMDIINARFKLIMSQVLAYGSLKAVLIITRAQEHIYQLNENSSDLDKRKVIAFYILLICQLKYDITDTKINPSLWYRMRIKEYPQNKEAYDSANNSIVEDLKLESFLMM